MGARGYAGFVVGRTLKRKQNWLPIGAPEIHLQGLTMRSQMKMVEQTGTSYGVDAFERGALVVDTAKTGKSCFLVGSLLGVLPWQKQGGVVSSPKHLHVVSLDNNAMGGVMDFLTKTCNAKPEALGFRIYNLERAVLQTSDDQAGNNMDFYNLLMSTVLTIRERAASQSGVHAMLISSLTVAGATFLRGLSGSPVEKGGGMSIDAWRRYAGMLHDFRTFSQAGDLHCFWESHLYRKAKIGETQESDSLLLSGSAGENFPTMVEHIFRVRRLHGQKFQDTNCDKAYLDIQASSDFVPGGRLFTERLAAQEKDLTVALTKLGKVVGNYGAKSSAPKAVKPELEKENSNG